LSDAAHNIGNQLTGEKFTSNNIPYKAVGKYAENTCQIKNSAFASVQDMCGTKSLHADREPNSIL
jgi:hypothetical protein